MTVEEAGDLLGISRTTAYELVSSGDILARRYGRRLVVPVSWVADQVGLEPTDIWTILERRDAKPTTADSRSTRPTRPTQPRRRGQATEPETPVGRQLDLLQAE